MALSTWHLRKLRKTPTPATGNRLRLAMELAGLTQLQLAAEIGLGQPYISAVARGQFETITVENAHIFARFFGCAIEDLFPAKHVVARQDRPQSGHLPAQQASRHLDGARRGGQVVVGDR